VTTDVVLLLVLAVGLAFTVSAAVGLGGSLVLVPALTLALGPKEGIALAALLLGCNNLLKVAAYRTTLPIRLSSVVVLCTIVGAAVGAALLARAPVAFVTPAVVCALALSLAFEGAGARRLQRSSAPVLAVASGATSGFSGTSGPLKGVAVKNLGLNRMHTVGAASMVSLAGDLTKTAVFAQAGLLGHTAWLVAAISLPLMVVGTLTGRRLTRWLGERRWTAVFWVTMVGYAARLCAG